HTTTHTLFPYTTLFRSSTYIWNPSPCSVQWKNTPVSGPQSARISSCSSKSPNFSSVSNIPPLPEPGGSCSPSSTPPSTDQWPPVDRKSTRLNSSHDQIS